MLDGLSLDQLRTFITTVDEGSFSAAARRLGRAQSAVSEMVRALEIQLGVTLFDRSGRYPQLTPAGNQLLAAAREITTKVDALKSRAKGMAAGLEPELSVVIDVFFPIHALAEAARDFREQFPSVPLRLSVEALGGTVQPILDRRANMGIVGTLPTMPPGIVTEPLVDVKFQVVAAASHPLAAIKGRVFDGFIFVTAEYNRSVPASLKNALDQAYVEWNRKPAAVVAYGGTGGSRAVEHLRTIAIELQMVPLRNAVHIGSGEFMKINPGLGGKEPISAIEAVILPSANAMLDELAWWTDVTVKGRAADKAKG